MKRINVAILIAILSFFLFSAESRSSQLYFNTDAIHPSYISLFSKYNFLFWNQLTTEQAELMANPNTLGNCFGYEYGAIEFSKDLVDHAKTLKEYHDRNYFKVWQLKQTSISKAKQLAKKYDKSLRQYYDEFYASTITDINEFAKSFVEEDCAKVYLIACASYHSFVGGNGFTIRNNRISYLEDKPGEETMRACHFTAVMQSPTSKYEYVTTDVSKFTKKIEAIHNVAFNPMKIGKGDPVYENFASLYSEIFGNEE